MREEKKLREKKNTNKGRQEITRKKNDEKEEITIEKKTRIKEEKKITPRKKIYINKNKI